MSNEKFTKGEWVISRGQIEDSFYDYPAISCEDVHIAQTSGIDESMPNAHLIACAPEMYNYLNSLVNGGIKFHVGNNKKLKTLLAKARGEL